MKYYSIGEFAKLTGKTTQTLRNWDKTGILKPSKIATSGHRYYLHEQLAQFYGLKSDKNKIVIGYCRVSASKQKDDLERQISNVKNYLIAQGKPFEIIADIGSGINYNKEGLQDLIRRIESGEIEKVVVLYKEILIRFGFELIEYIAKLNQCTIEIIDNTEKTQEQELVEDMIQIVNVFACRLQDKRATQAKKFVKDLKAHD